MSRTLILLSTQRALLGMITSEMRAITIGCSETEFILRVYFRSDYTDDDVDLLKEITSSIAADLNEINNFKEEAIVTQDSINQLSMLDEWVFIRRE